MSSVANLIVVIARVLALLGLGLLTACAGMDEQVTIPAAIGNPPPGNLQLSEALSDPARHAGTAVRWGGNVISVQQQSNGNAEIEILERSLDGQGRPKDSGPSSGRFLIRADASVDTQLYRMGSRITVAGIFQRLVRRQVGNSEQALALVEVKDFIRWVEPQLNPPYYARPYYDDPFDWPYYGPYYRWPYFFPGLHLGFSYSN